MSAYLGTQRIQLKSALDGGSGPAVWGSITGDLSAQADLKAALDSKAVPSDIKNTTISFTQGGVSKGSFTLNQSSPATIALDAGGGGGGADSLAVLSAVYGTRTGDPTYFGGNGLVNKVAAANSQGYEVASSYGWSIDADVYFAMPWASDSQFENLQYSTGALVTGVVCGGDYLDSPLPGGQSWKATRRQDSRVLGGGYIPDGGGVIHFTVPVQPGTDEGRWITFQFE